jgi:hypothetical protein
VEGEPIMTQRNPLALWLAVVASIGIVTLSSAQKSDAAALSVKIPELSRAGKYSEAIVLGKFHFVRCSNRGCAADRRSPGAANP